MQQALPLRFPAASSYACWSLFPALSIHYATHQSLIGVTITHELSQLQYVRTYSTPAHTAIDMHAYLCTHMHEQHEQQDPQDRVSQLALPLSLPNDSYYLLVLRYRRICRTSTVYIRTVESGFYVW